MTIEFLGTGTSSGVPMVGCDCTVCASTDPRDARLRTSALVRVSGLQLLIDAGPDLRQQMLRSHVRHLDGVLLTHSHIDHIAGIDELRVFNFFQKRSMDLYGSRSTLEAVRRMYGYAFATDKYPGTPELELHEIGLDAFDIGPVHITSVEVKHYRMPVFGFRIGGLAYVTDAKSIAPSEKEKLRGCDLLVLNALRHKTHISHLTLDEALALVDELKPRRACFTHISHQLGLHAEVSAGLPQGVSLAHDGLVVEVPDP